MRAKLLAPADLPSGNELEESTQARWGLPVVSTQPSRNRISQEVTDSVTILAHLLLRVQMFNY
jgi:hypothetical protein